MSHSSVCVGSTSSAVAGFGDRCHRVQFVLEANLVMSHGLGIGVAGFSLCWSTSSAVTGFGDRCHRVQFVLEALLVLSQGLGIGITGFSLC